MVKSFAGLLDWVLALFLKSFPILTPAQSPRSTLWEASNIEWRYIRLGAHLSFFTFTLYLCKHDVAVQTQPLASEKSGQFQGSRVGKTVLLLLAFPTPPTPPRPPPGLSLPFSLASQSQPAFRHIQVRLLWEAGPTVLALWPSCSSLATFVMCPI